MNEKQKPNIIYGVHPVMEGLSQDMEIEKIFLRQGLSPERASQIRSAAKKQEVPVQVVPEEKLRRLVGRVNHQGVVALQALITYHELEPLILSIQEKGEVPLLIMLDGVTDVRNFGAIARTAECMGAHGIIVPRQGSAPVNGDAIKTSAGALEYLPICREKNLVDSLMMLQAYEIQTVASTEKAADTFYQMDLLKPTCIVMGAEDKGISSQLLKRVDLLAQIPMQGKIESLNVSVAAGMMLAEASRQRGGA